VSERCDSARLAAILGEEPSPAVAEHCAACAECRADAATWSHVAATLAAARPPAPSPALAAHVRAAAAPLLAANVRRAGEARRALWRTVGRAVAAALLPLPFLVLIDGWVLRALYGTLSSVLPDALSLYFVVNYTTLLAVLLTLAYGAIPLLAERQSRLRREEIYG
jgi:anti-sigma factor RsiW